EEHQAEGFVLARQDEDPRLPERTDEEVFVGDEPCQMDPLLEARLRDGALDLRLHAPILADEDEPGGRIVLRQSPERLDEGEKALVGREAPDKEDERSLDAERLRARVRLGAGIAERRVAGRDDLDAGQWVPVLADEALFFVRLDDERARLGDDRGGEGTVIEPPQPVA